LVGIPCKHACAAISWKNEKPEEYCNSWLGLASYNASYEFFIQPVRGESYWEPTPFTKPVPPRVKISAGRPKKNRRRDATEELIGPGKVKGTLPDFQCTRCGLLGHNTNGCPNQGVPIKPKRWKLPTIAGTNPAETATTTEGQGEGGHVAEPVHIEPVQIATEIDVTQSQPVIDSQELDIEPVQTQDLHPQVVCYIYLCF
jgi:hypothetical protein